MGAVLALAGLSVASRPRVVGASVTAADPGRDAAPPTVAAHQEPQRGADARPRRPALRARTPIITPAVLTVPAAGVRTDLEHVGLDERGELEPPRDYGRAGWWVTGPKAGAGGPPAVFVGHVDSRRGPAVFYELPELQVGDEVEVADRAGRSVGFVVYAVERYPKARFPTRRVYGATAAPEVRLITCGGAFDARDGHYRDNIVVFARMRT